MKETHVGKWLATFLLLSSRARLEVTRLHLRRQAFARAFRALSSSISFPAPSTRRYLAHGPAGPLRPDLYSVTNSSNTALPLPSRPWCFSSGSCWRCLRLASRRNALIDACVYDVVMTTMSWKDFQSLYSSNTHFAHLCTAGNCICARPDNFLKRLGLNTTLFRGNTLTISRRTGSSSQSVTATAALCSAMRPVAP